MSDAFRTFSFGRRPVRPEVGNSDKLGQQAIRQFGKYSFNAVGEINPICDNAGQIVTEQPQPRYQNVRDLPLNKYGQGVFCRFRVGQGWRESGVYVITENDNASYIGECEILEDRFGSNGYGGISPANCFRGGQETNCRINKLVLNAVVDGGKLCLWFLHIAGGKAERLRVEAELIAGLRPSWNRQ
jgi:hypothetical protein